MPEAAIPSNCLSVIIPVFEEESTVGAIVDKVLARPEVGEVILVDDGSCDDSWDRIQELAEKDERVSTHHHAANRGKAASIRSGLKMASLEHVIIQDADLEYDPDQYPSLLEPILKGDAEVVYGSRYLQAGNQAQPIFGHTFGNKLLTLLSNVVNGQPLTDMETCYKMFKREVIDQITIEEDRFGFEPEVTAKLARMGIAIHEVPVRYQGRTHQQGKKIGWLDGLSAIRCIFKYRFGRSA